MEEMSLDEKLKEILAGYFEGPSIEPQNDDYDKQAAIKDIKQAFADEGYSKNLHRNVLGKWEPMSDMMSGQEWYERFKKELRQIDYRGNPTYTDSQILDAAKKTAGIE